jgi:hypothetical protein
MNEMIISFYSQSTKSNIEIPDVGSSDSSADEEVGLILQSNYLLLLEMNSVKQEVYFYNTLYFRSLSRHQYQRRR